MPTNIEWTHVPGYVGESWNTITGCTKISPGCANCYAESFGLRFKRTGPYLPGHDLQLHYDRLGAPFRWKKPHAVFVNSISDTFHEAIPDSFLIKMYAVMALTPQHIYILLTKRPERLPELRNRECSWGDVIQTEAEELRRRHSRLNLSYYDGTWPIQNLWLGTSAENQYWANIRIPILLSCAAVVHFASLEPLLGPIDLTSLKQTSGDVINGLYGWHKAKTLERVEGLDQVIVGGESGNTRKIRPMHPEWARDLRDQTKAAGKAFFMKQWGRFRPMTEYEIKSEPQKARFVSVDPRERHVKRALVDTDAWMTRGSKGDNGNLLDDVSWNEFPVMTTV